MARTALPLIAALLLAGCGTALTTPEDIPITRYPADQDFVLTVVMQTCSDTCSEYDEPSCSASVDRGDRVINLDASVGFSKKNEDGCVPVCGKDIIAHCQVPASTAGTYTVKSGSFSHQIFLE